MTLFDPWTATLEQAMGQPNATESAVGAIFQQVAATKVKNNREKIEAGTGFDVLEAVADCATHGLVMPDWLAKAYLKRYRAVQECKVDYWDAEESFGRPYRKGVQISAIRRRRTNRLKVYLAVHDAIDRDPQRPIDVGFWEDIGQLAGEGKTSSQVLYAKLVSSGFAAPVGDLKARRLGNVNPAKFRKLTGLRKRP